MAVVVFPHPPLWLKMVMTRIAFLLGASFGHGPVTLLFEARSRPGRPVKAPTVFVGPRGLPALENLSDRPLPPCHARVCQDFLAWARSPRAGCRSTRLCSRGVARATVWKITGGSRRRLERRNSSVTGGRCGHGASSAGRSAGVSEKHHSSFNRDAILTPCTIISYTHSRPKATPRRCVAETSRGSETRWIEAVPENRVPLTP
jgi:hypothetical protein